MTGDLYPQVVIPGDSVTITWSDEVMLDPACWLCGRKGSNARHYGMPVLACYDCDVTWWVQLMIRPRPSEFPILTARGRMTSERYIDHGEKNCPSPA